MYCVLPDLGPVATGGRMFIAVDGIDGAGKTTLVSQLSNLLGIQFQPLITKEPTNLSKWGQRLRESAKTGRLPKPVEIEYFHKDRLFHIKNVIRPAILQNRVVLTDRYVDSTLAFQCETIAEADRLYGVFKDEILIPDITFILKCPVEIGLDRIARNRPDRTKFENQDTLELARSIYESRKGEHYAFLDASGSIESTFNQAVFELIRRTPTLLRMTGNQTQTGRLVNSQDSVCLNSLKAAVGS